MIVYDLRCAAGHGFEGWFGSSAAFDMQKGKGLLACPQCGTSDVEKAPMAPAVPRKSNQMVSVPPQAANASPAPKVPGASAQVSATAPAEKIAHQSGRTAIANGPLPHELVQALEKLAKAQTAALEKSTWVGSSFAEKSRAMHYGEQKAEAIHGQATLEEAKSLLEEGITVAPLPFPIAPPDELN